MSDDDKEAQFEAARNRANAAYGEAQMDIFMELRSEFLLRLMREKGCDVDSAYAAMKYADDVHRASGVHDDTAIDWNMLADALTLAAYRIKYPKRFDKN